MLKIFRKYNKIILVIGGSFLMVVFLLPQAVQQFGPNPQKIASFKAGGKTYRGRDLYRASQDLQNLQTINRVASQETGVAPRMSPIQLESTTHWLLLVHEAERLGLVGGPQGGRSLLREVAEDTAQVQFLFNRGTATGAQQAQLTESLSQGLEAGRASVIDQGTPAEMIDDTLARLRGVRRLISLSGTVPSLSTREAAYFGREFLDTAVADVVLFGPAGFRDQVAEPSEEVLQAHFEKYRTVKASEDENGIGYLRAPAVRLEALQIDQSVIRAAVTLDPIEVNKLWRQNQARYGGDFPTVRPTVESDLRTDKVLEIMSKVQELLRREIFKSTKDLPTAEGGIRELPDDWAARRPSFEVLAERINILVGEEVELGETQPASVVEATDWLDASSLLTHPAAAARATVAGQVAQFPQLALSVGELEPEVSFGVQTGLTFGPIEIPQYRLFFFRVLEARPESPPDSLAEVRETAREDVVRIGAYELLLADEDLIREQIIEQGGYLELYDEFPSGLIARTGMTITSDAVRPPTGASPLNEVNKESVREAVVGLIKGWDPKVAATDLPLEQRVLAIPIPDEMSVAFVLVNSHRPMTIDQLRQNEYRVVSAAQTQWSDDPYANPFSFVAISERLEFEPLGDRDDDEESEGDGESDGAEPDDTPPAG